MTTTTLGEIGDRVAEIIERVYGTWNSQVRFRKEADQRGITLAQLVGAAIAGMVAELAENRTEEDR